MTNEWVSSILSVFVFIWEMTRIAKVIVCKKVQKIIENFVKKYLQFIFISYIIWELWQDSYEAWGCCRARKRRQVFRGANVWSTLQEPFGEMLANLTTSHCTNWCLQSSSLPRQKRRVRTRFFILKGRETHGLVYSHRLSYWLKSAKRRRLFLWQVK